MNVVEIIELVGVGVAIVFGVVSWYYSKKYTKNYSKGEKFMKTKQIPTMSWEEAPDIISPEDLSKILGCGISTSRNKFDEENFQIIKGIGNQKEILEILKEIKYLVPDSNVSSIALNDNLNNKSFSLKCLKPL